MSDLAVRQQLFSLFSAAFPKKAGEKANRPSIAARPFTPGSYMAGISPAARPLVQIFQRTQQLASLRQRQRLCAHRTGACPAGEASAFDFAAAVPPPLRYLKSASTAGRAHMAAPLWLVKRPFAKIFG
jgi:hypothetical protein